jgi:hypothetical protein
MWDFSSNPFDPQPMFSNPPPEYQLDGSIKGLEPLTDSGFLDFNGNGERDEYEYDPQYAGTLDNVHEDAYGKKLWQYDRVTICGEGMECTPVRYFPEQNEPEKGAIGIDNSQGDAELSETIVFHLGNLDTPGVKHIWIELEWIYIDESGNSVTDLDWYYNGYLPVSPWILASSEQDYEFWPGDEGFDYSDNDPFDNGLPFYDEGKGKWYWTSWFSIEPNPYWEDIELSLYASAGKQVYVDSFHVATECYNPIPEPASISLIGFGLLGLLGGSIRRRWKRR